MRRLKRPTGPEPDKETQMRLVRTVYLYKCDPPDMYYIEWSWLTRMGWMTHMKYMTTKEAQIYLREFTLVDDNDMSAGGYRRARYKRK